ncbi:catechol 2,3-dioxygenase-like lactoylglutathione lyase family enzyme [Mycolicibacterium sp. BK556]|uniref:VOC family protein n=1 Tax=Mycobacteriaceae TaxID=1762 RepID=UPI0010622ECB|nr:MULTISPECIES: VOC family protein [Mycobacteriaceae]MBB3604061.1 catechol 2,3-dioxygenase-like lactoylglutathione lyase family enzyme [Mycolicibacterium sp. BK556]MBB3634257.1 catechol 2,3-dioxygenase-like lactoylglutathione lyase family enzyme [Mycolicibacterium sp. BK607]TDO12353.1 glyoxalase/bleomycin resistance protein/dioxygenase superfamily protein [Mycobacterium sp. BK086]
MTSQTPVQIAWVTHDLDATEATLTALLGARKWIRMPDVHFGPDTCVHRGAPADYHADISLSYAGDTQLELIAPTSGESIYTEFLTQSGPGLHHICVEAADPDAFEAALAGAEVAARGEMPGGMQFAYVSAPAAGVPYLEIAYIPDDIRTFFDYVKQEQQ